jgi:iron-sulfur cluster assembly protein
MIRFTDEAVRQMEFLYRGAPEDAVGLRINVSRGCYGLNYRMAFENTRAGDDEMLQAGRVPILLDPMSQFLLLGTTVGFTDGPDGGGFTFENPNAVGACGGCPTAGRC